MDYGGKMLKEINTASDAKDAIEAYYFNECLITYEGKLKLQQFIQYQDNKIYKLEQIIKALKDELNK